MASHNLWYGNLVCLLLLLPEIAYTGLVAPDIYMVEANYSEWQFAGNRAKCELQHEIPRFGIGRFLRVAGEELSFRIDSFQPIPESVEALLREISPAWEPGKPDPLVQEISLKKGLVPVELKRKPAAWLLSSLAKGQIGSFDFVDWDDTRKTVHLRLSPVNYQRPYREFKRCLKDLSSMGFLAFKESEVRFPLDVHELGPAARDFLRQLADYLVADASIRRVEINGHADDQGTHPYNQRLSERRARSVFDFLTASGVNSALMQRDAYGESKPRMAGRTKRARAANRRAEIRLLR